MDVRRRTWHLHGLQGWQDFGQARKNLRGDARPRRFGRLQRRAKKTRAMGKRSFLLGVVYICILQGVRGSQGKAWEIGATAPPPAEILRTDFGYVTVTLLKDFTTTASKPQVVATARTRQQIKKDAASSSDSPWGAEGDPWSQWLQKSKVPTIPVPAPGLKPGEAQTKLNEVETRIQADVHKHVREQLQSIGKDVDAIVGQGKEEAEARLLSLESHVVELQQQGTRFENYFQHAQEQAEAQQQSILTLQAQAVQQQEISNALHSTLNSCTEQIGKQQLGLQALSSEVQNVQQGVEARIDHLLNAQTARLEELFVRSTEAEAKRARHSN